MAFTGQLAVITGGGSGVGQAWARQLAADGVIVALLDVNTEGMEVTASGFETIHTF
ncbi:SDR family NAD(P)-dependent oxidoreductase, partial [Luminiphilus sp.]|nr:SDR family NAD(P)-dependent oxidoreductase [Luminiphilus sp.]